MKNKTKIYIIAVFIVLLLVINYFYTSSKEKVVDQEKYKVGVLQLVSHPALDEIYRGIKENLPENIELTLLNAQGDQSQLAIMSDKLVKENELLVSITTPASLSVAKRTKDKPIVLSGVTYPVESGLIYSEEKSGNNVTGVSDQPPIDAQLKLIKTVQPEVKNIGVLYTVGEDNSVKQLEKIKELATKYDFNIIEAAVSNNNDLQQISETLIKKVDVLYLPIDNGLASGMSLIGKVGETYNKAIYPSAESMVKEGGLMTIGIDQYKIGAETANVVKKIISGEKPTDIPIVKMQEGEVILNEAVAERLNIKIPSSVKFRKAS